MTVLSISTHLHSLKTNKITLPPHAQAPSTTQPHRFESLWSTVTQGRSPQNVSLTTVTRPLIQRPKEAESQTPERFHALPTSPPHLPPQSWASGSSHLGTADGRAHGVTQPKLGMLRSWPLPTGPAKFPSHYNQPPAEGSVLTGLGPAGPRHQQTPEGQGVRNLGGGLEGHARPALAKNPSPRH